MATMGRSWREAAEQPDDEDDQPETALPHCSACGGFLPMEADQQGFDSLLDDHYEVRWCRKCGKRNQAIVF